jgi:hypothetical protein
MTGVLFECAGADVLLASESESCWREFFVNGAASEWYRMPVAMSLLWKGPRPAAAGMIRVRSGRGSVVLCQVPFPQDGYRKAGLFWSSLLRNLGIPCRRSLFDGEAAAPGGRRSDGHPVRVRYLEDPDPETRRAVLAMAGPTEVRVDNQGMVHGFDWKQADCPGGVFKAPAGASEIVVFFEVDPGRPRRLSPASAGLPDPSRQTLLDLRGGGTVRVFVNGRAYEPVRLEGGTPATVPDVDLDARPETLLLFWSVKGDSLRMLWRDRQGRPEVEFAFD